MKNIVLQILEFLPGFNCGSCKYKSCEDFANALSGNKAKMSQCTMLLQDRFSRQRKALSELLQKSDANIIEECKIVGVIDHYEADIFLEPLNGEPSCREVLLPFLNETYSVGEIIEYRPLACPITHYARIIKKEGSLLTVHMVGPCRRMDRNVKYKSAGLCMILAFEGCYYGKDIKPGQTVRFLPKHCMMQKVHSGVVVNVVDNRVLIEGVDLKVWQASATTNVLE
ncbi:(Fe-S)-binding protein [Plebeiibacterium marinum]|uniref:4Fe-4S domain-containing protein n=1 Tax=Plebeiibacterium marinum TaxID=2992111 RepID=A0AAE3MF47_9BACT|nr:(Fe-S)-binding protein [Plebeiobacterium marinum]MCW3806606.1 hypothetical protein [Plebeiobacterium marinum]